MFGCLVLGLGVVEGKSVWRNYRKRSRPKECVGVERNVKARDMERKRATEANRAKQGEDRTKPRFMWNAIA